MPLVLRIDNVDTLPDGGPVFVEIDRRGIDIGRDTYLDWTLPDPQRFISGKHCEIHFRDGSYWVHDVSTNGTSVNGQPGRLTEPHRVENGDRIHIGQYIIAAELSGSDAVDAARPSTASDAPKGGDPWADVPDAAAAVDKRDFAAHARASGPQGAPRSGDLAEEDISWGVEDVVPAASAADIDWATPAPPAATDPAADIAADWATPPSAPTVTADNGTPPDWRDGTPEVAPPAKPPVEDPPAAPDPFSQKEETSPKPETPSAPEVETSTAGAGLASQWADGEQAQPPPDPAPVAAPPPTNTAGFIAAFERGAGLPAGAVAGKTDEALAEELGALFKTVAANLQAMLAARAETKSAMRSAERTMIGAMENNPLKFSPSPEDALRLMFGEKTRSYLDAAQTIEQSFGDLQKHQLQTFGAMQQALQALIEDLDPENIAGATSKDGGLAGLVSSRRAKFWDTYVERFSAKSSRHERGMIDAFMILFAEMYDRQQ